MKSDRLPTLDRQFHRQPANINGGSSLTPNSRTQTTHTANKMADILQCPGAESMPNEKQRTYRVYPIMVLLRPAYELPCQG